MNPSSRILLGVAYSCLALFPGRHGAWADSATWNLNPATKIWNNPVNWPPATVPKNPSDHTATLPNSEKVLLAGGIGNSGLTRSAELYDPATGTWAATGDLGVAHKWHTATL